MHCEFLQCPELKCPPEQQMSVTDECCKFCQGISSFPLTLPPQDNIFLGDTHQQPREQQHQQRHKNIKLQHQELDSFQVNNFAQFKNNESTELHISSSKTKSGGTLHTITESTNDEKRVANVFSANSNSQFIREFLIDQRIHNRQTDDHDDIDNIQQDKQKTLGDDSETLSMLIITNDRSHGQMNLIDDQLGRVQHKDINFDLEQESYAKDVDKQDNLNLGKFNRESDAFR